jgi:hypothetical protein
MKERAMKRDADFTRLVDELYDLCSGNWGFNRTDACRKLFWRSPDGLQLRIKISISHDFFNEQQTRGNGEAEVEKEDQRTQLADKPNNSVTAEDEQQGGEEESDREDNMWTIIERTRQKLERQYIHWKEKTEKGNGSVTQPKANKRKRSVDSQEETNDEQVFAWSPVGGGRIIATAPTLEQLLEEVESWRECYIGGPAHKLKRREMPAHQTPEKRKRVKKDPPTPAPTPTPSIRQKSKTQQQKLSHQSATKNKPPPLVIDVDAPNNVAQPAGSDMLATTVEDNAFLEQQSVSNHERDGRDDDQNGNEDGDENEKGSLGEVVVGVGAEDIEARVKEDEDEEDGQRQQEKEEAGLELQIQSKKGCYLCVQCKKVLHKSSFSNKQNKKKKKTRMKCKQCMSTKKQKVEKVNFVRVNPE